MSKHIEVLNKRKLDEEKYPRSKRVLVFVYLLQQAWHLRFNSCRYESTLSSNLPRVDKPSKYTLILWQQSVLAATDGDAFLQLQ
jgi:hypothetical protein